VASSLGLHRPVVIGAALNEDTGSGRRVWRARNYDYWYHHDAGNVQSQQRVCPAKSWRQISRFLSFAREGDEALMHCAGDLKCKEHLLDVEDAFDDISS
jgi:hypothetical protein